MKIILNVIAFSLIMLSTSQAGYLNFGCISFEYTYDSQTSEFITYSTVITNNCDTEISRIPFHIVVRDESGNLLDSTKTYGFDLSPNGGIYTINFSIKNNPNNATIEIKAGKAY